MTDEKQITIRLDDKQERALELMLDGLKDSEITQQLEVSRQTLYRWRKYDGQFMEALEERRSMLREQAQDGLLELTEAALEAVRSALTEGDTKTRLQAAKMVFGMMNLGSKGKEKDNSILDLLGEAIRGIDYELGRGNL